MSTSEKKVLFFSPFGAWTVHAQVDAILASALRLRNVDVKIVGCDGLFGTCYVTAFSDNKKNTCIDCAKTGPAFFSNFHLPIIQLREYFDFQKYQNLTEKFSSYGFKELCEYQHHGLALGRELLPTICSQLRKSWKQIDSPDALPLYKEYLAYASIVFDIIYFMLKDWSITHLVETNGYGFLYTPARLAAKKLGVGILCHERGNIDSTFIFSNSVTGSSANYTRLVQIWENIVLSVEDLEQVKSFFSEREQGISCNGLPSFFDFETDPRTLRAYLNIPDEAPIVSFFSSTEYEFVYDWDEFEKLPTQRKVIDSLIELFSERNEYLVIRHHPNIAGGRGGSPAEIDMLGWAFEQARDLPPNIRVIMPAEKINSYALIWNSDVVLSSYSSVRHEAIARGVPAAGFNHPAYRMGLTSIIMSEDKEHLRHIVDNLLNHTLGIEDLRVLYRTIFTTAHRISRKFKSFGIKDSYLPSINIASFEELSPGKDLNLDAICNHILCGTEILPIPNSSNYINSLSQESDFLADELARVTKNKKLIRSTHSGINESLPKLLLICEPSLSISQLTRRFSFHRGVAIEIFVAKNPHELERHLTTANFDYHATVLNYIQYDHSWFSHAIKLLQKDNSLYGLGCKLMLPCEGGKEQDLSEYNKTTVVYRKYPSIDKAVKFEDKIMGVIHHTYDWENLF